MCEEMEMPCPCQHCKELFDLNEGHGSEKWYKNTVICASCAELEEKEIEADDEMEDLLSTISEAEFTLKEAKQRLELLKSRTKW